MSLPPPATQPPAPGPRALVCRCSVSATLRPESVAAALERVDAGAARAVVADDLCDLAASDGRRMARWAAGGALRLVAACRPRAVRNLFRAAGVELDGAVRLLDLRAESPGEVARAFERVDAAGGPAAPDGAAGAVRADPAAPPAWYPVIDRDRCTRCGQCAGFCLFGVYASDADGTPRVVQPRSCKLNCPACARICPEAAIVFPKCPESPIDGAQITDEAAQRDRIRADIDRFLGPDPCAALRARRLRHAGPVDRARFERAMEERRRAGAPTEGAAP